MRRKTHKKNAEAGHEQDEEAREGKRDPATGLRRRARSWRASRPFSDQGKWKTGMRKNELLWAKKSVTRSIAAAHQNVRQLRGDMEAGRSGTCGWSAGPKTLGVSADKADLDASMRLPDRGSHTGGCESQGLRVGLGLAGAQGGRGGGDGGKRLGGKKTTCCRQCRQKHCTRPGRRRPCRNRRRPGSAWRREPRRRCWWRTRRRPASGRPCRGRRRAGRT